MLCREVLISIWHCKVYFSIIQTRLFIKAYFVDIIHLLYVPCVENYIILMLNTIQEYTNTRFYALKGALYAFMEMAINIY